MRQEDDYRRGRHVVSALNVHLVFVTKYRRGVLTGKHLDTLGEVFASVCADFGAELVELDAEDDPVHLVVASPPHVAVARLVNALKGVSAPRLRQRYRVRTHRGTCGRRRMSRPRLVVHRWRPQGVHPPAAHSWPAGLTPP
jgi:putative transposase